jgi:hypothetical protein
MLSRVVLAEASNEVVEKPSQNIAHVMNALQDERIGVGRSRWRNARYKRIDTSPKFFPTALLHLEKPETKVLSVSRKFQEECPLMTAMGNMPDLAGQEMSVAARHRFLLKACIWASKTRLQALLRLEYYGLIQKDQRHMLVRPDLLPRQSR